VETHRGADVGAAARQLERHRAAKAKADRGDARRIDLGSRAQRLETARGAGA